MRNKIQLFISYCHKNEDSVQDFIKHMSCLTDKGIVEIWYDKKMNGGDEINETIDEHINNSDIICLFISADYLASGACKEEIEMALKRHDQDKARVVPIILSPCGWQDHKDISSLLAIPTDGRPISSFAKSDDGWFDVYNKIKSLILKYHKLKTLRFSKDFADRLEDATLLTKAHYGKRDVKLDDIFVYPELSRVDDSAKRKKARETVVNAEDLVKEFSKWKNIAIFGEDQSGKTSLLKKYIGSLKEKNFIPIYWDIKKKGSQGSFAYGIQTLFNEEYDTQEDLDSYDQSRIVVIIDNFHMVEHAKKVIDDLSKYENSIIVGDDIFCMDLRNESLLTRYHKFSIMECKPSLRNELIQKWVDMTDDKEDKFVNEKYKKIDEKTELVENALGSASGKFIMPAYPFFILSLISAYDTLDKPLEQQITSQGHCYQALIYFFLREQGVSNDDFDTYINFLTEFAYKIYKTKEELPQTELDEFFAEYSMEYNLPQKEDTIIKKLNSPNIIKISSCRNYSFEYPYLYYYFAGKHFAEHSDTSDPENNQTVHEIDEIIDNLHVDENAYIAIFISHHTKNKHIQNKVIEVAKELFKSFNQATLDQGEMSFFDSDSTNISLILPKYNDNPDEVRKEMLRRHDEMEEANGNEPPAEELSEDDMVKELRRSFKTTEVIGQIIRNRAGSLKRTDLKDLFSEGMDILLRFLSSFFKLVKDIISHPNSLWLFAERTALSNESWKKLSSSQQQKIIKNWFWRNNFMVIYVVMRKIAHSLGSNQLGEIVKEVCDGRNTPATFIVKHQILMWCCKNLDIKGLGKMKDLKFSEVAQNIMQLMVVNHCQMHNIDFKDRSRLASTLNIRRDLLLPHSTK